MEPWLDSLSEDWDSSPQSDNQSVQEQSKKSSVLSSAENASIVQKPTQKAFSDPDPAWKKPTIAKDLFSPIAIQAIFNQPTAPAIQTSPLASTLPFLRGTCETKPPSPLHHVPFPTSAKSSLTLQSLQEQREQHPKDENSSPSFHAQPQTSGSSLTADFSPVYISKYNTIDGRVDYMTLDLSNPELRNEYDRVISQEHQRSPLKSLNPNNLDRQSAAVNRLPKSKIPRRSTALNHSQTSRRSLRSEGLRSDSLLPSDSVSQIQSLSPPAPQSRPQISRPTSPSSIAQNKNTSADHDKSAASPLKLFDDHDTFTNKQLLQHLNRLGHSQSPDVQGTPTRPATASQSSPLPTLPSICSISPAHEYVSSQVIGQHRRMEAVIGKKRKDAIYANDLISSDPSLIAKRQILRPRNPTPAQIRELDNHVGSHADSESAFDSLLALSPRRLLSTHGPQDAAKIRALASEVATFRSQNKQRPTGSRSASISTQDYFAEAMELMNILRSKNHLRREIDLEEAHDLTSQPLSRPPSRDGVRSVWRSFIPTSLDPKLTHHLQKYEETGDDSFLEASVLKSIRSSAASEHANSLCKSGSLIAARTRRHSDSELPSEIATCAESPSQPHSSNRSAGSSAKTITTSSTLKARQMALIAPDQVCHLIQNEVIGMRFDSVRRSWVRSKPRNISRPAEPHVSSSTGTEEDPFCQIPDLEISEHVEDDGPKESISCHSADRLKNLGEEPQIAPPQEIASNQRNRYVEDRATGSPDLAVSSSEVLRPRLANQDLEGNFEASFNDEGSMDHSQCSEMQQVSGESVMRTVEDIEEIPRRSVSSSDAPNPARIQRRETSVFFSSPPVSKEWSPRNFSDSENEEIVPELRRLHTKRRQASTGMIGRTSSNRHRKDEQLPRLDEHREMSFVKTIPDGRTMSLTLSVSTPMPNRRVSSRMMPDGRKLFNSLSPLSDFTINQDDAQHLESRRLAPELQPMTQARFFRGPQPALATDEIVRKLTKAEPDQSYWDFMRSLNLQHIGLDNLHMLDAFCPRVEELNVSGNRLSQVVGAPSHIREMIAPNNQLSSLTTWTHLMNIQYLDISKNDIENFQSLASLIHLRDLRADCNRITSLEGLLDLEGLLTLSVRGNKVEVLDLEGANLRRLSTLDVSDNLIHTVQGLEQMPQLVELNLTSNKLETFPSSQRQNDRPCRIRRLNVDHNALYRLDLTGLPYLDTLAADYNKLASVIGIEQHARLRTLSIRCQQQISSDGQLPNCLNLGRLYMSGACLAPVPVLSQPMINLQSLDLSFAGLQNLPITFGKMLPNIRTLNLNANSLDSLKSLRGIISLGRLFIAENRFRRMRRLLRELSDFGHDLTEFDCRGNMVCHGFYAGHQTEKHRLANMMEHKQDQRAWHGDEEDWDDRLSNLLATRDLDRDVLHLQRLDHDTRLRRRIYEILMAAKCRRLKHLDGAAIKRDNVFTRDDAWHDLTQLGVVQEIDSDL